MSNELRETVLINDGENNKIVWFDDNGMEIPITEPVAGLDIIVHGNNNTVRLGASIKACNSKIEIGDIVAGNDGAFVEVHWTPAFENVNIICKWGKNQYCTWGRHSTCHGACLHLVDENCICRIGNDCQIASGVQIWCCDGHSILDKNTDEIINQPRAIIIEDHCWLCECARILKGTHVRTGSILGGGGLACKDYVETNVIIAGNPGKIVRRDIVWHRMNNYHLKSNRNKS